MYIPSSILTLHIGFPSSPYMLRPYTEPEIVGLPPDQQAQRRKFNQRLSAIRVRVEHAFGILKGRFMSLKCFPTPDSHSLKDVYRDVQAMMVLHNLCIDFHDHPQNIPFFDIHDEDFSLDDVDLPVPNEPALPQPEHADVPPWETEQWLREAGYAKRLAIMNSLFPL